MSLGKTFNHLSQQTASWKPYIIFCRHVLARMQWYAHRQGMTS